MVSSDINGGATQPSESAYLFLMKSGQYDAVFLSHATTERVTSRSHQSLSDRGTSTHHQAEAAGCFACETMLESIGACAWSRWWKKTAVCLNASCSSSDLEWFHPVSTWKCSSHCHIRTFTLQKHQLVLKLKRWTTWEVPKSEAKVKPKYLNHPLVAGCTIAHKLLPLPLFQYEVGLQPN